jgi:signal transduction histidine kinase
LQNSTGGNGLANMQKRVAKLGGTIKIESADGNGTNITIRVPQK